MGDAKMAAAPKSKRTTWYVFTSTRWQMVNLLPAAAIGLNKIDHLLILLGKSSGSAARQVDRQHAELPRAAIVQAMSRENRASELPAATLEGDPDDMNHWRRAVPEFFAARPGPLEIIFNYTGGPKDVSIGVLLGLQDLARDRDDIAVRFVAKHARHITWPFENVREPVTAGRNTISLDAYLLAHGYRELAPDQRAARERKALHGEALTRKLAQEVFSGDNQAVIDGRLNLLNMLKPQFANDLPGMAREAAEKAARSKGFPTGTLDRELLAFASWLAEALTRAEGVERQGSKLRLSATAQKRLRGDWFEDWIWLRARDALASLGAGIHLGLILGDAHDGRPRQGEQDLEIDVAIFCGDQLHAIECKTGKPGGLQQELDHLAHVKDSVLGPYGNAWLWRARELPSAGGAEADDGVVGLAKSYAIAERLRLRVAAGASEIEAELRFLAVLSGDTDQVVTAQ
jgi:hypothetical protein